MKYLLRVLISIDVLIMSIINGKRNETLSAAAWSLEQDGKFMGRIFRPVIDFIFHGVEEKHCKQSWLTENTSEKRA